MSVRFLFVSLMSLLASDLIPMNINIAEFQFSIDAKYLALKFFVEISFYNIFIFNIDIILEKIKPNVNIWKNDG